MIALFEYRGVRMLPKRGSMLALVRLLNYLPCPCQQCQLELAIHVGRYDRELQQLCTDFAASTTRVRRGRRDRSAPCST
jgi:hypothetical protein